MLEKLLKNLETAEAESNRLDAIYEADPENKKAEDAWMEAYEEEFKAHEAVAEFLIKVLKANGMADINRATVNKMIAENRDRLATIAATL